ncbi:1105_t:CDS:2 [Paraglomus brasilianum]|uniref:Molybdopterin synthase catalytic subunit n=1 Tax=Paraglomus brasilianum TaxID=144538 RepID=A0A9N9BA81_9GLOM|nr:1105_t:CDS:2 [Paraglomus brasilianum]
MTESVDFVKLTTDPLDLQEIVDLVKDNGAGAISTFSGTTRNTFNGKTVVQLDYEAYTPMAIKLLSSLIVTARSQWLITKAAIYHRLGTVPVGETSVIVAVSTVHREESFRAVEFLVNELKASVPIWKKEIYSDGSVWKENAESKRCCRS